MRSRVAAIVSLGLLAAAAAVAHPEEPAEAPRAGAEPHAGWRVPMLERFVSHPGRLGVQLQDATPELRAFLRAPEDRGVLVVRVNEGSPAEEAGLRVGDLILSIDGEAVAETHEVVHAVLSAEKDAKLALEVSREGKTRKLEATLAGEPPMAARPMRWMEERWPELRDGLERRMRELERRMQELEQRLKASAPASDELET